MTKRFTVDDGLEDVLCWEINDKENENMTCGECVKLLNELHEENEQLKNALGHNYVEHKRCVNNYVDKIKEVEKENEQLKQTIKTQNFNYENAKGIIHSSEHQIQRLQDEIEQLKQSNKDARCILKREFDFATEQRQKHLDDPVVANAYDIIRFDIRKSLDKLGGLE